MTVIVKNAPNSQRKYTLGDMKDGDAFIHNGSVYVTNTYGDSIAYSLDGSSRLWDYELDEEVQPVTVEVSIVAYRHTGKPE